MNNEHTVVRALTMINMEITKKDLFTDFNYRLWMFFLSTHIAFMSIFGCLFLFHVSQFIIETNKLPCQLCQSFAIKSFSVSIRQQLASKTGKIVNVMRSSHFQRNEIQIKLNELNSLATQKKWISSIAVPDRHVNIKNNE